MLKNLLNEKSLFYILNKDMTTSVFDILMPFISNNVLLLFLPVIIFIILLKIIRLKNKQQLFLTLLRMFILLLFTIVISDSITNLLKQLFARLRPPLVLGDVRLLVGIGSSYSMPSGHAANTTALSTILIIYIISEFKNSLINYFVIIYLVIVSISVAFSRVYIGVHWVSDVLVGLSIGMLSAFTVFYTEKLLKKLFIKKNYFTIVLFFLFIVTIFRIYYIVTGPIDLSPDEAHYWDWSRHLQLSYYSKGPAIAYIIKISTAILGNSVIGIRMPAIILSFLSSLILYKLSMEIGKKLSLSLEKISIAALFSAIQLQIIPLLSTYGVIMTTDALLIFFWSLALLLFWKIISTYNLKSDIKTWTGLGIIVGVGLLSKYTMAFFYICSFLYIILRKRDLLFKFHPWIAFLVSMLVFSPVILWNAQNHWVTFLHTAGQAHLSEGFIIKPERFFEFIGSQIGVISPIMFIFIALSLFYLYKECSLLWWFCVPILAFFLLKSLHAKVQANWALPGYITGIIATSLYVVKKWQSFSKQRKLLFILGVSISVLITILAHYPAAIRIPYKFDPSVRLRGWEELGEYISEKIKYELPEETLFIFSDSYQVTAELAFYVNGHPKVFCINLGRRMNQYDLWEGFYNLIGYDAIFVKKGDSGLPITVRKSFKECKEEILSIYENEKILKNFTIGICYGFKGIKKTQPHSF